MCFTNSQATTKKKSCNFYAKTEEKMGYIMIIKMREGGIEEDKERTRPMNRKQSQIWFTLIQLYRYQLYM